MYYSSIKQKTYNLESAPFVSKGEGSIFNVVSEPELLAKIYHKQSGSMSFSSISNRREKLLNMISSSPGNNLQYLAWPLDALLNEEKEVCGFIMKRFHNMTALSMILPDEANIDWQKRVVIAHNLCDVVWEVHEMNQVIGDMNPDNFGVDLTGSFHVCGFDVDSFHYRDQKNNIYPCYVGLAPYYAPELQVLISRGQDMRTLDPTKTFSKETDNFALSVLIFQLLFLGYHPFTGARAIGYGSSTVVRKSETNILNKISPYFNPTPGMSKPQTAPSLDIIPKNIQEMFRRAFLDAPEKRPTALVWQGVLRDLFKSITRCSKGHMYSGTLSKCPWCKKATPNPAPKVKIAIIHQDNLGKILKTEDLYISAGEVKNVWARSFPGYKLAESCLNIKSVYVEKNGNPNVSSVRFIYEPVPNPEPKPTPPPENVKITVIHQDLDGHVLETENMYLKADETKYAYAKNILGYKLAETSTNRKAVNVDKHGMPNVSTIRFSYVEDTQKEVKTYEKKSSGWKLFLILLIALGLLYGISTSGTSNNMKNSTGSTNTTKSATSSTTGSTKSTTEQTLPAEKVTYRGGGIYIGETKNGYRDGLGIYYHESGEYCIGEWSHDKGHKIQVFQHDFDACFLEELNNGIRDGKFLLVDSENDTIDIEQYKMGAVVGKSKRIEYWESSGWHFYEYTDGSLRTKTEMGSVGWNFDNYTYHGEKYVKGEHRKGICVKNYSNRVYQGEEIAGINEGIGWMKWDDGTTYIGEYSNGKRNGTGLYKYPSGNMYFGNWLDNNFSGKGIFVYNDKSVYIGIWNDDEKDGTGVRVSSEGNVYQEVWNRGKKVSSKKISR